MFFWEKQFWRLTFCSFVFITCTMYEDIFSRLARSKFRSLFRLGQKEQEYLATKGADVIRSHAADFISTRLAPAHPKNDGKQTPMRGHPVFIAQHATAACCRGCLSKWHDIPKGRNLTPPEQDYLVDMLMNWIEMVSEVSPSFR